jgi:hypothetical protein
MWALHIIKENSAGCIGAILAVLALAWAACANPGIFWSTNRRPGKQQGKNKDNCIRRLRPVGYERLKGIKRMVKSIVTILQCRLFLLCQTAVIRHVHFRKQGFRLRQQVAGKRPVARFSLAGQVTGPLQHHVSLIPAQL